MSTYRHENIKFSDKGLQLRLPVDLVPSGQYSRLSNALPQIEGQLLTRDGMVSLDAPVKTSFIYILNGTNGVLTIARTVNPHGLTAGQTVVLTVVYVASGAPVLTLGPYSVTVTSVANPNAFTFTPGITSGGAGIIFSNVFAEVTAPSIRNTLVSTPITNIFRLNEAVNGLPTVRLIATNGRIYQTSLTSSLAWEEIVGPISPGSPIPSAIMGFGGGPIAFVAFRFTLDSATWAILCDGVQMWKYRPGLSESQIEFVQLGNAPPTVAATASAGSAGNLNSAGGTGYDWRYTYVDGLAKTESNPSPIDMSSGGTSTTYPTAYTNPAITGDVAFLNPHNAIDTDPTTASSGNATAGSSTSTTVTQSVDCLWIDWAQPSGLVDSTILNVTANLTVTTSGTGEAEASAGLSYSYDGGATYHGLAGIDQFEPGTNSTGQQTYTVVIPSSAAYPNFILKAIGTATATGFRDGIEHYSANASVSILVYDINTTVMQEGSANLLTLTNQIGVVCVTPSPLPQHTFINLYRRGGSLPDAWRLVSQSQVSALSIGTCGAGTLEIDDNVSDATLSSSSILLLDNDQPVSSVTKTNQPLSFIWGPVGLDVRILGCGDPARPESVYFSKPGNADAWPPENFIEVSSPGTPIIAGCVYNTLSFAYSREAIYELVEGLGTGTTYTPFKTPSSHGLFSPWALAVGPMMYFVSKDGIYSTSGGIETSIVEDDIKPLFPTYDKPGEDVHGYEAVDMTQPSKMRLTYHNSELFFAYIGATTGTRQILVYDILKKRWRGMDTSVGISEVYSEPNTTSSLLYGTPSGSVYQAGGAVDSGDLGVVENFLASSVAGVSTFATITYYIRLVRISSTIRFVSPGAEAISYEFPISLDSAHVIQIVIPEPTEGTTAWQLWIGTSPGGETVYVQFPEPLASRTILINSPTGTAGTFPTVGISNAISTLIRTGAHDQGAPLNQKQYGNVIFDIDPGGATNTAPVTIIPYINGEIANDSTLTITGSGRQQIPLDLSDVFAFNLEYEISWAGFTLGDGSVVQPILFQTETLYFLEPVQVTHWQSQPTSFSFPGFVHIRDMYVAIRSTNAVTLTITVDGGAEVLTYTIPSTNNQRIKQFVQLDSNKGLMYEFSLDSTIPFRTYEEDLEIRVKPWLGLLGYQIQRVLGGETEA